MPFFSCQDVFLPKFSSCGNPRENAQFVTFCYRFYVNEFPSGGSVHNLPPLWKFPVERSVDNVENIGFPTGISAFLPVERAVEKVVDNVDNFAFSHIRGLITSPEGNREPARK